MTRLLRLAATIIALSIFGTLSGFAQANLEKLCDRLADNPPAGVKLVSIIEHRNPESKKLERRTMLFE
ncbi:MAG: hypothetical protein K2F71_01240, partial [Paramuribaculum sp.]|nr:hypothetical protein [Paramuribaculum sp.]